jgi:NADH:ubiquinone oxidoreductase subunit 2 (subunit N)
MLWIMLEMNTFSFCFLVKTERKQKERTTEIRIKYFIIQSLSSALLLRRAVITKTTFFFLRRNLITISLIIKIAAAPFHK